MSIILFIVVKKSEKKIIDTRFDKESNRLKAGVS